MSNARNLSDLLGTGTTIATASIADDAITAAKIATDAVVADGLSSSAIAAGDLPAGSILQVIQTHKQDTYANSSTSFADVTGLSVSITPSSTSNKILVIARISGMLWSHGHTFFRLQRDSSTIGIGDTAGSRTRCATSTGNSSDWQTSDHTIHYLDSPATTGATTYKVQGKAEYGNLYVNRSSRDGNSSSDQRTTSAITVMEIAG